MALPGNRCWNFVRFLLVAPVLHGPSVQALALGRNNFDVAVEWLLEHAEDPDAAEPPSQQQLREVWGGGSGSRSVADNVERLVVGI